MSKQILSQSTIYLSIPGRSGIAQDYDAMHSGQIENETKLATNLDAVELRAMALYDIDTRYEQRLIRDDDFFLAQGWHNRTDVLRHCNLVVPSSGDPYIDLEGTEQDAAFQDVGIGCNIGIRVSGRYVAKAPASRGIWTDSDGSYSSYLRGSFTDYFLCTKGGTIAYLKDTTSSGTTTSNKIYCTSLTSYDIYGDPLYWDYQFIDENHVFTAMHPVDGYAYQPPSENINITSDGFWLFTLDHFNGDALPQGGSAHGPN